MRNLENTESNVVNIIEAAAKRSGVDVFDGIAADHARILIEVQRRANLRGKEGKISHSQRSQWAKNVQSLIGELKESGFGTKDLYNAGKSESFYATYEDSQAYSKNLTAMQKADSPKQVVGYNKYLELIELISCLTGQSLGTLAVRLTEGVSIVGDISAIPDGCFELSRKLESIACRVGRQKGLIKKFQLLAEKRERHLCSGGGCVWPDVQWSFEDDTYTPLPGKCIGAGPWVGDAQQALLDPEYSDLTVGSLRITEEDDPLVADGKREFRAEYIENPAKRRLARNAYYVDSSTAYSDQRSAPTISGKLMTISPYEDSLFVLPLHFAGIMEEPERLKNIRGKYLISQREELWGPLEWAWNQEPIKSYLGPESDLHGWFSAGHHLAIFLYPNESMNGLVPIIRLGGEEWCFVAPLDATTISEMAESVILPKNTPRTFPYQTESLITYLEMIIESGELERDWKESADLLDQCPLWNVSK